MKSPICESSHFFFYAHLLLLGSGDLFKALCFLNGFSSHICFLVMHVNVLVGKMKGHLAVLKGLVDGR